MLSVYTRHLTDCPQKDIQYRRCRCPKWIQGTVAHQPFLRKSAKTNSWDQAEKIARQWEEEIIDPTAKRVLIDTAVDTYLMHKEGQQVSIGWMRKVRRMCEGLRKFSREIGLLHLDQLSTQELTKWRSTWPYNSLSASKQQERLRQFFKYCVDCMWLDRNPAKAMGRIQVKQKPTDYFTPEQYEKILNVTDSEEFWTKNPYQLVRLRALIELMRYSGLRITDAVTLERERMVDGTLLFYQQKTGLPVFLPLPPHVVEQLEALDSVNRKYFFWSGIGERTRACNPWEASLKLLFERADLGKRAHPHMFRDTFAVELLLAGVPIDQVSIMLGHKSVKITEKHYAPFVKARQEQIAASLMKMWPQPKLRLMKKTGA